MIVTELGLHFVRDGDRWRCNEYPDLGMLRGGGYEVDGQGLDTLAGAVRFLKGERQHRPVDAPSWPIRHGHARGRCQVAATCDLTADAPPDVPGPS